MDMLTENGFKLCLVSNAKSERSAKIAEMLGVPCVTYANKPGTSGVLKAIELMQTTPKQSVMIGDQIFTDVIAGRLSGCYTIFVERYNKKEIWYVALKRPFERIVRLCGHF